MTVIKHIFQSSIADDPTAASNGEVLPSHWNADHTLLDVVVGAPLYGDSEGEIAQSSAEFYTEATEASILAAATAANAAGGGVVRLPAGRITLTAPLPTYNGVAYHGTPLVQNFPGEQTAGAGGTILVGDGTFIGIAYHETDLGVAPTNYATFVAGMLKGFAVRDITFENFSYGIKIGALYNPGMQECFFERLCFVACTQWGMWVENDMLCRYYNISANNCAVGQIARLGSGFTALNCGNSIWQGTIATTPPDLNARGIVNWARGASNLTQISSLHEGCYRTSPSEVVQAATMTNASANITVTDGTKFPLDMPMSFSASVNGFTTNKVYFVVSQSSNVIQVANKMRGTAIAATGNSAVNAKTKGFAFMEFSTLDAGCSFIGPKITEVDLEGGASCRLVMQDVSQGAHVDESIIGSSDTYISIVRVNSKYGFYIVPTATIQSDSDSTFNMDFIAGTTGVRLKLGAISLDYINLSTAYFNWNDDTILFRENVGRLMQINGTNSQSLYIGNTYTDSSNYEIGGITWQAVSNRLQIGSFSAGTGTARPVEFVSGGSGFLNYGVNSAGELTTNKVFNTVNIYGGGFSAEASANIIFSKYFSRATAGISFLYNGTGSHYGYTGHVTADIWAAGSSSNGTSFTSTALRWTKDESLIAGGTAAVATNATDGFLYIPTCAGTPTGVPTAFTGKVAMVFDTTNNKLYIYDGGWLGGTAPGAFT